MKIKEVDLICEECKKTYHVESKRSLKTTRYCSKDCFNKSRFGKNNPIHKIKNREEVNSKISKGLLNSEKHKEAMKSKARSKKLSLAFKGKKKKLSEKTREIFRKNALNTLEKLRKKNKISKIERITEARLLENNIKYEAQKRLLNITKADFYLPEYRIVIYCDGDYWHNLPDYIKRDKRQNKLLKKEGYKVLRFWEHLINKTNGQCVIDALINV